MGALRRLLLNRWSLLGWLWLAAVVGLHFGQIRHDRLPLDLARSFPAGEPAPPGMALGTTLAVIMEHELDDGFGWRPNDFLLWGPGLWADNNASRQLGILQAVRETVRVMKDHLTKVSSDQFDQNLVDADTMLRNEATRLWIPSAESRFRRGVEHLRAYVLGLKPELATSKPINQRHVELMRLVQAWTDLLGDAHANLYREKVRKRRLRPWETDDLFYHAQGFAHVMAPCIEAIQRDYGETLNERPIIPQLFDEVQASLRAAAKLKPLMVLDGTPAGVLANHRRNLDGYITEARQKMYSLREELEK